ncbi:MAG TPA: UDP-3-O-(3-hydroxymyristoyl)glucosamine N-acyltransferase [Chiayiivirga sp.]|nr:UDP-3-O-(3-hydroxymyristoyl)glucosamine N-acyltransferase [Chiayiivirga sp.]
MNVRLDELAERFGLRVHGDGTREIHGVATLARATPAHLGFLANPRYRRELGACQAGAIVLRESDTPHWSGDALLAKDPYTAFARIAALFEAREPALPGIHPSAVIATDAVVDPAAHVGPLVSIGARSRIEAGANLGPGCVIGEDCVVGPDCTLVARVTLVCRVQLGPRVRIHPGAVIGADGFGLTMHEGHWIKVPQLGGVNIGADCEIGANTTIDRGALDDTVLEDDVRLDNQIQIGHNVVIGAHTAMAGCVAVAGSARIGRYCQIGGGAGISGHIEIADKVTVLAKSFVTHSIHAAGVVSSAIPARDAKAWRRSLAQLNRLGADRRGTSDD